MYICRASGALASPVLALQIFRTLDTDGSGRLDVHELQAALSQCGFNYDLHTVQALARTFAGGSLGDASLSVTQFAGLNRWLDNVMARFSAALAPGQATLPRAAARAALSAQLADECAEAALNRTHYTVDGPAFDAFLSSADADGGSSLDTPEFVRAAVALRSLATVFKAFDTDKDGLVTMSFAQMVFAVSHVI